MVEVIEAIKSRRSIRSYKSKPITDELLQKVLGAARLAPSANNAQPWKMIVVRNEEKKLKVAQAANNKNWLAEAPVIIVACGIPDDADAYMGGYMNSFPVDVAIALDHLTLMAASEGLATCWIGHFNEDKLKDLLEIPEDIHIVALLPIGYPNEEKETKGRKHISELVSYDKFQ
jgi:nitroreductase